MLQNAVHVKNNIQDLYNVTVQCEFQTKVWIRYILTTANINSNLNIPKNQYTFHERTKHESLNFELLYIIIIHTL